jgi:hypothetical protein
MGELVIEAVAQGTECIAFDDLYLGAVPRVLMQRDGWGFSGQRRPVRFADWKKEAYDEHRL